MRGFRSQALPVALLLLSVAWRDTGAQSDHGPVFRLEPGLLTDNFISSGGRASSTGFNLRFETRLPTRSRLLTPVIGASVEPYGTSIAGDAGHNTPRLFAGNIFPLWGPRRTKGWLTVEAPLLIYYTYGGGGEHSHRLYGRDIYAQLATRMHIGQKMLRDLGRVWSRVDAYGFLEQNLTPNKVFGVRHRDYFNPIALVGISIPFGDTERVPQ